MAARDPLAAMSPDGRAFLARIGRRYGNREVLAQARHTLDALERHGETLQRYGFSAADARLLADAHARAAARTTARKKSTSSAYVHGLNEAKAARTRARSVLLSAYRRLRMIGNGEHDPQALEAIAEVLAATSGPGGDDRVYGADLSRLRAVFGLPGVAAAVAESGGDEALRMLELASTNLAKLDAKARAQELELADRADEDAIDGMIVELARTAQFAAKVAAAELGERGLAKAFRLRLMG